MRNEIVAMTHPKVEPPVTPLSRLAFELYFTVLSWAPEQRTSRVGRVLQKLARLRLLLVLGEAHAKYTTRLARIEQTQCCVERVSERASERESRRQLLYSVRPPRMCTSDGLNFT